MHYFGVIGFMALGCIFIIFGVAHEFTWFRRRGGVIVKGCVIDNIESPSGEVGTAYCPVVEYISDGITLSFVSKYGSNAPLTKGASIDVLISKLSKEPEVYTFSNRVLFTVVPILFGLLFVLVAIGIRP